MLKKGKSKGFNFENQPNAILIVVFLSLALFSKRTAVLTFAIIPMCLFFFRKLTYYAAVWSVFTEYKFIINELSSQILSLLQFPTKIIVGVFYEKVSCPDLFVSFD